MSAWRTAFFMLDFMRDHSRVIFKLISNQFGAAFLAISLGLAASQNKVLFLCTSIFSILFLLFLDYTVVWEEGAKSRIRVDAGRERYNPLNGLWLGILSGLPNLILVAVTALTYFLASTNGPFGWEWAGNISAVVNVFTRLWQAMYIGVVQYAAPGNVYALLLIPIPTILLCLGGYMLGLSNCRMFGIFTLNKQSKKDGAKKK